MDDITPPHWGTPDPMTELARRCEDAEGPADFDRDMLIDIFRTLRPRSSFANGGDSDEARNTFIRLWEGGAPLDAAMTLVPDGWSIGLGDLRGYAPIIWRAHLRDHNDPSASSRRWVEGHAKTAALALCAAALRAGGENG